MRILVAVIDCKGTSGGTRVEWNEMLFFKFIWHKIFEIIVLNCIVNSDENAVLIDRVQLFSGLTLADIDFAFRTADSGQLSYCILYTHDVYVFFVFSA